MNQPQFQPLKRFLALDTSTACLALAVMENNKVLHTIKAAGERNHSVHLLPLVQKGLAEAGVSPSEVDGIAVGIGPGSYTGTRIAVTAAKTLAWAWKIPVVGISSLHAFAWSETFSAADRGPGVNWVIPFMDARRGQAYTALFQGQGAGMPVRQNEDAIRLMENWIEEIKRLWTDTPADEQPEEVWFVGDNGNHESTIEGLRPLLGNRLHIAVCDMEGEPVGQLGAERLMHGEADDVHRLVPNYTQLAEAEKLLRKP
ncbi:tRNA (adenosine(37)-N6)-threonylcarbamoyltransferase complex dimerization subunit type 1 TsaB [Paenibacillus sp.]|jgi:tRNA threonylcarbamoyladenosine biosynthesis protein TsaB|uniref:tRNA (adenosine(37)-N6)-threonylcarbamoyltransferase complex dimerization subunit type 1 TsaB n=1 Tax=Paenibacillus sp. TaxID=58172 RepID=UPI002821BA27|nr:tRNA (adenosine(37)-N6)-threonylcarbamoyltransferase complex dimerization subunit type 1 TsaB [Paenibacillus sp.]MDR0270354.1 tRNA (adenosine(37)-N6)-threonylcarbamoyltransferase complex dimerization subunit type 1 TsaB [Paenibacillus sp.]